MVPSTIERENMMAPYEYPNITIEDYQTINHNSQTARYEYLDGELRMLASASADYSTITANIPCGGTIITFGTVLSA